MDNFDLRKYLAENRLNIGANLSFQDRMNLGKKRAKKERGIMMLMNRWIYDNEPPSVQWEFNPTDESKINLFKGEESIPYKTISLQNVIETYPEVALRYNL